jgi:probable rRNA maturation factor
MGIQVFVADEQSDRPVDAERWRDLAERVLSERRVSEAAELNVLFVDSATMASLNERFLSRIGPTDVLSFPVEDELGLPGPPPAGPQPDASGPGRDLAGPEEMPVLLGDVVICPEVAWNNAPEHAGSYDDELALLLVHGILHLLGMDHELEAEAEQMESLERELLGRFHSSGGGRG